MRVRTRGDDNHPHSLEFISNRESKQNIFCYLVLFCVVRHFSNSQLSLCLFHWILTQEYRDQ